MALLSVPLLLLAPQVDVWTQPVLAPAATGALTDAVDYGTVFSTGWELDAQGRRRPFRYADGVGLDLGSLTPGGEGEARATDTGGRTVGWMEGMVHGALVRQPFLYDDFVGTGLSVIPLSLGGTLPGWAEDISLFGHLVVGTMVLPGGALQAWEHDPNLGTPALTLPTPAGWESEALSAERLLIGGLVRDPSGREFAAVWDWHRNLTLIPTPGTGDARVTGVPHDGLDTVCGWFVDAQGNQRAFTADVSTAPPTVTVLPTLGGAWNRAQATDGHVVLGSSADAQGRPRAFFHELASGETRDLNERTPDLGGLVLTDAVSVRFGPLLGLVGEESGHSTGLTGRQVGFHPFALTAGSQAPLSVQNAPAGTLAAFAYAFRAGSTPVPGCPGLFADLDAPRLAGWSRNGALWVDVPSAAQGLTVLLQAVLPEACLTTEVRTLTVQ